MTRKIHKIDLEGKILGRVASEIAILLRGKNKATFEPYLDEGDIVNVTNADKIKVTGKKLDKKIYYRYSGYQGGIKEETLGRLMQRKPEEALRRAVYNMLPKNKLRDKMIKRLRFVK
jgi:large subunit ribosomal protein L13